MRRLSLPLPALALIAGSLLVAACTSEYHPEYHPVTVSNFSQNLAYPVSVTNGGAPTERSPVYIVPGQAVAGAPLPAGMAPAPPPPPGFFDRE